MEFFTNAQMVGNKIWLRYQDGDKDLYEWIEDFQPTLYVKSNSPTKYKTIFGEALKPIQTEGLKHAKKMIKEYQGIQGFSMFGNPNWEYSYIYERFGNRLKFDPSKIKCAFIDIETKVGENSKGFPYPYMALEEITLITHMFRGKYYVFATKDFDLEEHNLIGLDVYKNVYENEDDMLKAYVKFWASDYPHAATGWNFEAFDICYIINRIRQRLGDDVVKRLSPINQVSVEFLEDDPTTLKRVSVRGIEILDYLAMFKKFIPGERDFSLDAVSEDLLGEKKVPNPTGGSFRDFYTGDFEFYGEPSNEIQTLAKKRTEMRKLESETDEFKKLDALVRKKCWDIFVWYNVRDVDLVERLNRKLGLLNQAYTIAYLVGMNYSDVFGTVKPWDIFIQNENCRKGVFSSTDDNSNSMPRQLMGGFVHLYKAGLYRNGVTLDATSLYPSIMMGFNISPDTLVEYDNIPDELKMYYDVNHINNFFDNGFPVGLEEKLKKYNLTMTLNGMFYRTDIKGFIPEIIEGVFIQRKAEKVSMLGYENQLEQIEIELKTCTDKERIALLNKSKFDLEALAATANNMQLALKTLMNALYGACGNEWFRFFNFYNAEAITSSGQFAIRYNTRHINGYINKIVGSPENTINVIYNDTDSISVSLDSIIKHVGVSTSHPKFIDALCGYADTKLNKETETACNQIADNLNMYARKLSFKREKVFLSGLYVVKKRYALSVIDDEGVRFGEPKIKITGLETKRSDVPQVCRNALKEVINIILNKTEKDLQKFVSQFEADWHKLKIEDIATPTGVNKLNIYADPRTIYQKGAQAHIRAALIYNHMLKKYGIENDYEAIDNGSKIKYVKLTKPNHFHDNVIAFQGRIPEEFDLQRYVDYAEHYHGSFEKAALRMTDAAGWNMTHVEDLEDWFA